MNRIYSLVWNRSLHTLQVASELAAHPRGSGATGGASSVRRRLLVLACGVALGMAALALPAWSATCPAGAAPIGSATGAAGTTGADGNGTAGGAAAGAPAGSNMCLVANYFVTGGKGGDAAATGGHGGAGGAGFLGSGFKLTVDGGVGGGAGGTGYGAAGGNGGSAVMGGGFNLTNDGYVHGGTGGYGYSATAGTGGAAVVVRGAGRTVVTNDVMIRGGAGGIGVYAAGGNGGAGIVGSRFVVTNNNALFGGNAGYGFHGDGGNGAAAIAGGDIHVINTGGGIFGGKGGMGYFGNGGQGADAIDGNNVTVANYAQIGGGSGGNGGLFLHGGGAYGTGGNGGAGGTGIVASGQSTLVNAEAGSVYGGMGGQSVLDAGAGGAAVVATGSGVAVTNYGAVIGGAGGLGGVGGSGGGGGAGTIAAGGASVANHGDMSGGAGGNGGFNGSVSGIGGDGGAAISGAVLALGGSDFSLTNDGNVSGGKGGYGVSAVAGNGGAGVSGNGFAADNSGAITGGTGGQGYNLSGTASTHAGGAGGAGVGGVAFVLGNSGNVAGGVGGLGFHEAAGAGGTGVEGSGFTLSNGKGAVYGGAGGQGEYGTAGTGGAAVAGSGFVLTNAGYIHGGRGGYGKYARGGNGGAAVVAAGNTLSTVTNNEMIRGGAGGDGLYANAGNAGAGVSGSNFVLASAGSLFGGYGGAGYFGNGGDGAAGVEGHDFTVTVTDGGIGGGHGGSGYFGDGGAGGDAIRGSNITVNIVNQREVFGGGGGTGGFYINGTGYGTGGVGKAGGDGIEASGDSLITSDGSITGGNGGRSAIHSGDGGDGVRVSDAGTLVRNDGSILGGAGALGAIGSAGGAGGSGVAADDGASIVNSDAIQGGNGANGGFDASQLASGAGGNGGAGISGTPATAAGAGVVDFRLLNGGVVQGGNGGYGVAATAGNGGAGISGNGFSANSRGYLYGGTGGQGYNLSGTASGFTGGVGGAGASGTAFGLVNTGYVSGGTGGLGFYEGAGAGGAGVTGNDFGLVNSGVIVGGQGGEGLYGAAGAGGVGVVSTGGARVLNAGVIAGGLSGDGTTRADAVEFSGGGNMLLLASGYGFAGNVISTSGSSAGGDTLALGGNADAAFDLSQVVASDPTGWTGSVQYYGFNQYLKTGNSTWILTGSTSVTAPWEVQTGGLVVGGAPADGGTSLGGNVTVDATALLGGFGAIGGNVEVHSGGMLSPGTAGTAGQLAVGGNLALDAGSDLQFDLVTANGATANDRVTVGGTLGFASAGSTLNLAGAAAPDPGLYHLFDYGMLQAGGCAVAGNTGCINIASAPTGTNTGDYAVVNDTSRNQVDLFAGLDLGMNIWAPGYGSHNAQFGGNGSWTARSPDWVRVSTSGISTRGRMSPNPGFAVFTGTPGKVRVSNRWGRVETTGMQFAVDGYRLTGDDLTLIGHHGAAPIIRVGDGTAAGAGMTAEIDNDLRGDAGLRKTGLGTLVLAGYNQFDGGTSVAGGTLQVGNGRSQAALTSGVNMAAGSVLDVASRASVFGTNGSDGSDANWWSNAAAGNGADGGVGVAGSGFAMANAGLVMGGSAGSGGNAWGSNGTGGDGGNGGAGVSGSGFTLVNTGIISGGAGGQAGDGGSWWFGGASGDAGAGGTGVASTGGSTVVNAGVVIGGFPGGFGAFADAVEFSGGGNTLVLESGGQFIGNVVSSSGAANGGDTLNLGGDGNSWFGNYFDVSAIDASLPRRYSGTQYVGFRNFEKSGSSVWTLSGVGDPSVDWTVAGGVLRAGSRALAGNVDVSRAGTLDAAPWIGGSLSNAGTVVVRGGDTRVDGNFTQTASGVLSVSLGSELKVAGRATLAGDLNVLGADRGYITTRHQDVLAAGSVDGTFAALTLSPGVFLQSTIGYTPTSVWLDTRSLDISKAAQAMGMTSTPDLQAAARLQSSFDMLDARLAAGGSIGASELATLAAAGAIQHAPTAAFAEASLQSLSGQLPAASAAMLFDSLDTSTAALAGHLDLVRQGHRKAGVWARNLGWQGSMQASGYAGTTVQNTGSMVGADFRVGRNGVVGYALSASRGFGQIDGAFDHGRNRASSVTVYGGWARGPWFVDGSVGTGWYRQDMQRLLMLGQIAAPVAGGFTGSFNLATGEAGMRLHFVGASIAPFVNLRYEQLDEGAFAEHGAGGFGLKAGSRGTGRWQAGLGMRATRGWHLSNGMHLQLDGSATWRHTLSQYGGAFQASFTGFDDWMPLSGVGLSRNYSVLKMGVGLWPTRDLELHLGLEGQQGRHQHAEAAMLESTLRF